MKRCDDEEGDDAILDEIWGPRFNSSSAAARSARPQTDHNGEPDAESLETVRNVKPRQPVVSTPSKVVGAPKGGLKKELDKSDSLVLQCIQFITSFAEDATALKLAVKQAQALQGKLSARLSADHLALCTTDAPPERGPETLASLRRQEQNVNAAVGLIAAMSVTGSGMCVTGSGGGDESSGDGDELIAARDATKTTSP